MIKANIRSEFIHEYVDNLCTVLRNIPVKDLSQAIECLERMFIEGKQVFIAGNGGSAATASHMANDMVKGVATVEGKGFRAIALSDNVPLITAIANDVGYSEIFASQLAAFGQPGDALILISGSGNSLNLIRAAQVARQMNLVTIGFLGQGGGRLVSLVDINVIVPSDDYGYIEDTHISFDHLITSYFKTWSKSKYGS